MKQSFYLVIALACTSCGWLPDRTMDYRKAEPLAELRLPAGLEMDGEQPLFTVPDDEFQVPTPPQLDIVRRASEATPGEAGQADPTNTRVVLARDGSGYPMIMMATSYAWAWEYVGQALSGTDLEVDDRDRQSGVFYLTVPRGYGLDDKSAQLKLSQTANGIQITVLQPKGGALVAKGPGQDILQVLYDQL